MVEKFEICSPGESVVCDQMGVPPEKTVISGVYLIRLDGSKVCVRKPFETAVLNTPNYEI